MELSDATEKIPIDTTEIDPVSFRLVAQCLNHYANPGPKTTLIMGSKMKVKTEWRYTSASQCSQSVDRDNFAFIKKLVNIRTI
jgi:hypothetical protein